MPITAPAIEKRIFTVRGRQVLLDEDLADLYGVETKRLVEQVKRNVERFPADFMFQLDAGEAEVLRSQIAISKSSRGGRRYAPYAFTEQGVAMLSGVLRSKRAIAVISRSCGRSLNCAARQLPTQPSRSGSGSLSERPLRDSADTMSSWIRSSRH